MDGRACISIPCWLLVPYGGWAIEQVLHGNLEHGLNFYLFGFFYVTGIVYFRRFPPAHSGECFLPPPHSSSGERFFPLSSMVDGPLARRVSYGTCPSSL